MATLHKVYKEASYCLKIKCVHGRFPFVKYPNVEYVDFHRSVWAEPSLPALTRESFESEIEP